MGRETPKYVSIAGDLAHSIQLGQLVNGDKLPPQRELAARLGVTIGTITRAYAVLEQRGLASARMGDGTYVRCGEPGFAHQTPINLAHNVPLSTELEVGALKQALGDLASDNKMLREMLDYQSELGVDRHREAGARYLRHLGTKGESNRVMITNGVQQALAFVLRIFARPGDTVLTESLSYHGILPLAREFRLQLVGVETDAQGLLPHALERAANTFGAKLLYCMPTLQTPTGSTMSMVRRIEVAEVVRRCKLLLIEDGVHAVGQKSPLPALSTWVPDRSFLLTSFSKAVTAGLRVGYLEADPKWLNKFAAVMRADSFMVAPLLPEVVTRWLESGLMQQLINTHRDLQIERLDRVRALMGEASRRWDEALDFHCDPGFPFIWLRLPARWEAEELAAVLLREGVLVRTANHFKMGRGVAPQALRISLNAPGSLDALELGMRKLLRTLLKPADMEARAQSN